MRQTGEKETHETDRRERRLMRQIGEKETLETFRREGDS
jgi:hypothetical protein